MALHWLTLSRPERIRLLAGTTAGIAISLLAAGLGQLEAGRGLEQRFALRWLFTFRGDITPPPQLAIAAINTRSARAIFLPEDPVKFYRCEALAVGAPRAGYRALPGLPARWPRCLHALLIDRLTEAGARVIVFDVLFRERLPLPIARESADVLKDDDTLFAQAARRSGRVLIGQKIDAGPDGVLRPAALSPVIEEAVLGSAPFSLPLSSTDRYDRFKLFIEDDDWSTPGLPMLAVQAYALPAYARFRTILTGFPGLLGDDAPLSEADIRAAGKLQATTLLFRMSLATHSASVQSAWMRRQQTAGANEDDRLMQSVMQAYVGPSLLQLNFYGPPGRIPARDFSDVLRLGQDELASWAGGKIVVVGYQEYESLEQVEHFPTPITPDGHVGHSGVELLATSIANLLDNTALRTAPPALEYAALVVLALVTCLAAYGLGTSAAIAAVGATAAAYAGTAFIAFAQARIWMPLVVPLTMAVTLGLGSGLVFRYQEARSQRDRIRALFTKFVPRDFIDAFERSADNALSSRESVECISVATDAAQFTTLAESMTSEALAQLLNEYFQRLFGPIAKTEGIVSDIVGDAMLALWPVRGPHTRQAACHALLAMHKASVDFSETAARGGMRTRFGADMGLVSLGAIGGQEHYEYRAIGDSVNSANRLQELNKKLGTGMLVALPLVEGLNEFLVRDLGAFRLRGKSRMVPVGELLGLRSEATKAQLRLCAHYELFARALRASQIERARKLLEQARVDFPDDPPTRFLLQALDRPGAVRGGALLTD